jgi:hypothetical protein
MVTYKNSFYDNDKKDRNPVLTTDLKPVEYKGYLIYHRINSTIKSGNVFDIVKDDICIGMYAGINGAKQRIDTWTQKI